MIHALIALGIQASIGFLTGNWWAGAAYGAALYIGREHAAAGYRWIEHYGDGHRANMPLWGPFDPRVWDVKSLTDWLLPAIAVTALGIAVNS